MYFLSPQIRKAVIFFCQKGGYTLFNKEKNAGKSFFQEFHTIKCAVHPL